MKTRATTLLAALCWLSIEGHAQIALSGQTGAHLLKSAPTGSPRAVSSGRPLFGWESVLFVDAPVTEDVTAMITARAAEGREIGFDYAAIRLSNLTPLHLTIQAGKIALPFGNLGERRYPRTNPLFGLPLMYEYRSSLPNHAVSETDLLNSRGKGTGMRLLNLGMYDVGAMVSGSVGILSLAVAVTNGTVSSVSYDGNASNSDLGKIVRLTVSPLTGLTFGGGYAWGAYLEDSGTDYSTVGVDVNAHVQQSAEFDFEFSRGHLVLTGEAVFTTWPAPIDTRTEQFKVFGYTLEGKYTLMPRLYAAFRIGGLSFGDVRLGPAVGPWDDDVTEWEGGVGYFLDRNVLLKAIRRETRIHGGTWPGDHLTVLQLAIAY